MNNMPMWAFQYRKRYEVTCDMPDEQLENPDLASFNTASGMRSHVTTKEKPNNIIIVLFQYRKRYEVTCDVTI